MMLGGGLTLKMPEHGRDSDPPKRSRGTSMSPSSIQGMPRHSRGQGVKFSVHSPTSETSPNASQTPVEKPSSTEYEQLLALLANEQQDELRAAVVRHVVRPGKAVLRKGDSGCSLYIVDSGHLVSNSGSVTTKFSAGNLLGLEAFATALPPPNASLLDLLAHRLFSARPARSQNVFAVSQCEILELKIDSGADIFGSVSSRAAHSFLMHMCSKLDSSRENSISP